MDVRYTTFIFNALQTSENSSLVKNSADIHLLKLLPFIRSTN